MQTLQLTPDEKNKFYSKELQRFLMFQNQVLNIVQAQLLQILIQNFLIFT